MSTIKCQYIKCAFEFVFERFCNSTHVCGTSLYIKNRLTHSWIELKKAIKPSQYLVRIQTPRIQIWQSQKKVLLLLNWSNTFPRPLSASFANGFSWILHSFLRNHSFTAVFATSLSGCPIVTGNSSVGSSHFQDA